MKFNMPQIGMTMTEGIIGTWLKNDGDVVKEGEEILEITTEKLTNTLEAPASGILKIIAQEGESVPCGEVVAEIL